ncbi:thioredoxin family protein [Verrucomicrobiota bacterium]
MSTTSRVIIVALLVCAVGVVVAVKRGPSKPCCARQSPQEQQSVAAVSEAAMPVPGGPLPRLVDLGSGKCIPCKMMAPILEELEKEYVDTFEVEFIDVWKDPEAGERYGIRMIPTQVFFDAAGRELFRHEGFLGKEDILAKWKEYGVAVSTEPEE